ncbi:MAG: permease-like cell division protein FtsX [Elusimicrobium sp.]|jgi:hypothetical protein|nr:permease-like cell division protein FtsX [Elusimicrobium sp.]
MSEESIALSAETQVDIKPRQKVFPGYGRLFFITLFIALLAQSFCFFYFQARAVSAVLHGDFKIILALNSAPAQERVNEIGSALSSNPDVLSVKFISAEDGFNIIREQNPRLADNFVFLGRRPMADYFELTLGDAALADIDAWVKTNLSPIPDARAYYKSGAAFAAAYGANILKFLNLLAGVLLAVLFSFVFFVEGSGVKPAGPRWPAVLTALVSYGVSYGVFYFLLEPLRQTGGVFFMFTVLEAQCVIAFITVVSGWVFAKWKRF